MRQLISSLALSVILCVSAFGQAQGTIPGTVEHGIRLSDSAFFGILEWYDLVSPFENIMEASGRIHPTRPIWGDFPDDAVEIGWHRLCRRSRGGPPKIWDGLARDEDGARIPLLVLSTGTGADREIVYVLGDGFQPLPPKEDVLAVRSLESESDTPELREELIQVVLDPQASELLWKYALRRLYLLEDDPDRRFDLVLDPRIQSQGSGPRVAYAQGLLTGREAADYAKYRLVERPGGGHYRFHGPIPEELPAIMLKLLAVFETTPSADMAHTALSSFLGNAAHKAGFTEVEWARIRARIRAALENPEHPLHSLPAERKEAANKTIQRVLREPNPFAPEK